MRLSDAIALGRVLTTRTDSRNYCGCALSMGLRGAGRDKGLIEPVAFGTMEAAHASAKWHLAEKNVWPWITQPMRVPEDVVRCQCFGDEVSAAYNIISDMFRMVEQGTYSLEKLIDWVRSVEPEPEPTEKVAIQEASVEVCDEPREKLVAKGGD